MSTSEEKTKQARNACRKAASKFLSSGELWGVARRLNLKDPENEFWKRNALSALAFDICWTDQHYHEFGHDFNAAQQAIAEASSVKQRFCCALVASQISP
jgi:hypothetical protein